ncbi:DUF4198 domain-containing protein [Maribacter sp. MMG018]|uniref:DUF4198 domain-containing protein n=1 Tax=Maribacter sp. MMG018 TaxID=2822688 RepID=UPI001B35CEF6|nr:DUF4198 domain-containing protein [Maribacter sp. MMG018]MBQ4914221.1 DUF4198 domain-containing protein [Maribacter sp. MMG018]
MKKLITTITLLVITATPSFAHYLWLETDRTGNIGQEQEVRVYYGEYTYGVIETVQGDNFPKVSNFQLWLVLPDGSRTTLKTTAQKDHYVAYFTPNTNGTYTVALDNDQIDVLDYTKWDFGIFKPQYHATAKVQVGTLFTDTKITNDQGIAIKELNSDNEEIRLQVFYKGRPLAKNEFKIYVSDLWSKTIETDAQGIVHFLLPWKAKYTMETTFEERVPGSYNGKEYEFIWHCATYCINQ